MTQVTSSPVQHVIGHHRCPDIPQLVTNQRMWLFHLENQRLLLLGLNMALRTKSFLETQRSQTLQPFRILKKKVEIAASEKKSALCLQPYAAKKIWGEVHPSHLQPPTLTPGAGES